MLQASKKSKPTYGLSYSSKFGEMKGYCKNLYNFICAACKMRPTRESQQQVSVLTPNKM
jgi:hypothetical protein